MTTHDSALIELKSITKRFPGVLALDDVSFAIRAGEIHAILGENGAGKSTLMNVLAGDLSPDSGQIFFNGKQVSISSPLIAQKMGISVVYQELALCGNLTIGENIGLNSVASRSNWSFVRRNNFDSDARKVLARLGLEHVNPRQLVSRLSVAQQQMVEIAKAISQKATILILDEPNSALTYEETEHLFKVLNQLRAEGVAIIYVSHRLEEVLQIADHITVMRDGRHIDTLPNDDSTTVESLITRMVGRSIDHFRKQERPHIQSAPVSLKVEEFNSPTTVNNVSLTLKKGEILGVAGLPDSGKDDLVNALFGLRASKGKVVVQDREVHITSPSSALRHGIALIPADRRGSGALLTMSVEDNAAISILKQMSAGGVMKRSAIRQLSQRYAQQFSTKISSHRQKMRTLSGGNQQKVILARGLATEPTVLLLHEPTRGIDVGAKAEIYGILHDLAQKGMSILIVSSELTELMSQCDRLLVMYMGTIAGEFTQANMSEEQILACAMGQSAPVNVG